MAAKIYSILYLEWEVRKVNTDGTERLTVEIHTVKGLRQHVLVSDNDADNMDANFARFDLGSWLGEFKMNGDDDSRCNGIVALVSDLLGVATVSLENNSSESRIITSPLRDKILSKLDLGNLNCLTSKFIAGFIPDLRVDIELVGALKDFKNYTNNSGHIYNIALGRSKNNSVRIAQNQDADGLATFYSTIAAEFIQLQMIEALLTKDYIKATDRDKVCERVSIEVYKNVKDPENRLTILLAPANSDLKSKIDADEMCILLQTAFNKGLYRELENLISMVGEEIHQELGTALPEPLQPKVSNMGKCVDRLNLTEKFLDMGIIPESKATLTILDSNPANISESGIVTMIVSGGASDGSIQDRIDQVYDNMTWSKLDNMIKSGELNQDRMQKWTDTMTQNDRCIGKNSMNVALNDDFPLTHAVLIERIRAEKDPRVIELLKSLMVIVCPFDCSQCPISKN